MTKITEFLGVNLYTRTKSMEDRVYYAFMAIAHNYRSHDIVRKYFYRYPLYSSKHLAYKDWCKVQDLCKQGLTKHILDEIKTIKNQFNKRKQYNFSHLDNFKF